MGISFKSKPIPAARLIGDCAWNTMPATALRNFDAAPASLISIFQNAHINRQET
jgi:hypothetical protein